MRHSGQGMILSFICTRLNFIHNQYQFWLKLAFEEDNKLKSLLINFSLAELFLNTKTLNAHCWFAIIIYLFLT